MKIRHFTNAALALSFLALTAQAQASRAANEYYNRGNSLSQKGDYEGAIADFTKAIEISARLDNRSRGDDWKSKTRVGAAATNFDDVGVIDPLTALAYNNRGVARFQLGDFSGAIGDCDRA